MKGGDKMKIAIFSDIHGNKEALKVIIDDAKKENINNVICLGDVIGIGPNPSECMDLIIENNIEMVLGNHELYFIKGTQIDDEMGESEIKHQEWVKSKITEEQKEFLEKCSLQVEKTIKNKRILFEHFPIDYESKDLYPFCDLKIVKDGEINNVCSSLNYDLIFIGHEHKSFTIDNKLYDVGSSGCTKDGKTKYTILNTEDFDITVKELEYDRNEFVEELLKYDYPDRNLIAKWFFGLKL